MARLSVRDVASLLGVVEQTVYTHEQKGRLKAVSRSPLLFDADEVRVAKLLNEADINEGAKHGIASERLLDAKLKHLVTPSDDGRYSLDDVE